MPILYAASFSAVAVTVQQDFFEITTPATFVAVLHQIVISQSSETGDAQEEFLRLLIKRGATSTGTGGSTLTPTPLDHPSVASASTVKANNTTKATGGTPTTLYIESWNIRGSFFYTPTPELRTIIAPSTRLTLELATTPVDSITIDGTMYYEEIG